MTVEIDKLLKPDALTEQAYLNKNKFEDVDLDDLKELYPELQIVHLLVDTSSNSKDDWLAINSVSR